MDTAFDTLIYIIVGIISLTLIIQIFTTISHYMTVDNVEDALFKSNEDVSIYVNNSCDVVPYVINCFSHDTGVCYVIGLRNDLNITQLKECLNASGILESSIDIKAYPGTNVVSIYNNKTKVIVYG